MKYLFEYLKYIGIYFLFVIIIALITSLIGLMGANTSNLVVILNIGVIFVLSLFAVQKSEEKGIVRGFKLGIILTILMFIISLIAFKNEDFVKQFIYYIILIVSSTLGGSLGKNIKINLFKKKKNL